MTHTAEQIKEQIQFASENIEAYSFQINNTIWNEADLNRLRSRLTYWKVAKRAFERELRELEPA